MAVDRSRLPQPGDEPGFTFPEIRRRRMANGAQAWTVEHHAVPIVSVLVLIQAGAALDPADRPGLAAIAADLLDEGCGDLDALALHETLGRLGAHLETEVGADATLVSVTALERFAAPALAVLADLIGKPQLDPREFLRVRDLRLNRLLQLADIPSALADRAFFELLYGAHPYGHLSIGTEASLNAMTIDEVRAFHGAMYDPARSTIIAVGDATHDRLSDLIEQAFGPWISGPDAAAVVPNLQTVAPPSSSRKLSLIHRPGAPQSELRIGHVAAARSSPDYHALVTLNMVLGGQFVSRLNLNLREGKGYTYGVRTSFDFRRGPGPFSLHTSVQSDATADAVGESLIELSQIRDERPVTADELELARSALTRGYPRGFETAGQVGRAAAQLALYDLPDDYFTRFVPTVRSLTRDDVTRAAARYIDPARLLTVVVGDRDKVAPTLAKFGLVDE
jgi:predicted Zn-dependent peptidase